MVYIVSAGILDSPQDSAAPTLGAVRLKAMDYLARREHSQRELAQKLNQYFGETAIVKTVLEHLADEGLQSDSRFAESFAASHIRRGQGPTRIQQELKAKGIDQSIIHKVLARADHEWLALAKTIMSKKFGGPPQSHAERGQYSRFLQYRGFTISQIQQLFSQKPE
jgi:regulatory protein